MQALRRTLTISFVAALAWPQQASGSGNALKTAAWKEMCQTAKELRAVPTAAANKLASTRQTIAELEATALRLAAVAASQADVGDAATLGALAKELSTEAASLSSGYTAKTNKALTAAAASAAVYGGISEFLNLLTAGITGATNGCLAKQDGATLIGSRDELTDCPIDKELTVEETSSTIKTTFTADGITTLKTDNVKDTGSNAALCVLFQTPTDAPSKLFHKAAEFLAAGGTLSVNTATTTIKTEHGKKISKETNKVGTALIKQAHTQTHELLTEPENDPTSASKSKIKALASDTNFTATVVRQLKLIGMAGSDKTLEDYAKSKIKTLLDDGKANFDTKWNALIDTKIYDGKSEKVKTEKASSITSTKELIQSVLYYQIDLKTKLKRVKEELEQKKNDCEKETEEVCNAIEGEQECNNTKDCHYDSKKDGKKCTLKKEVKEKLEKTNQETGVKDGNKDRCTKHGTDKTKCEAENTAGQTPVCGFRKGKDNEPEQDKEMCRNGSFLVNNKFALSMVSAAFVALLF
uniref:Variant surface glycoprotein 1125.34 n=2 Tax=Trypanosoma brucei TaxID=5691 RepID=M4SZX0_9TRYP|nr:variant surface glycoprotein 365 [Trypanosoma brucei]APD72587.1 variant surface glycoprotein 1125.34 [Trypanosoma brucei]CAD90550.1 variant surface glycoprotein precursor [Trypanosoma brucei brucei]